MPLQVVDFNGDGLQDVILVTREGIFGWAQVSHYLCDLQLQCQSRSSGILGLITTGTDSN